MGELKKMKKYLEKLVLKHPKLEKIKENITETFKILKQAYEKDHTVFVCGNGGSAADAEHIVGELMKSFILPRKIDSAFNRQLTELFGEEGAYIGSRLQKGLRTISLNGHPSLSSAYINDVDGSMVFAQQLFVMGRAGDVLIAISTSGNSDNVVKCVQLAKARGIKTVVMSGCGGGKCGKLADCLINVPEEETYLIQELHLPIYHTLCLMLEDYFYGEK